MILTHAPPSTAATQRETRAIPIVFVAVSDPIGPGFVASLARPGGNITGLLTFEPGITGKWLAMLKEIAPHLERVALVGNPGTTNYDYFQLTAEAAAQSLMVKLIPYRVATAADIEGAIIDFADVPNGGYLRPQIRQASVIATSSSRSPPVIACLRSTRSDFMSPMAA